MLSPLVASANSARPGVTKTEIAQRAAVSGEKTWLLSYGDTGEAVAAAQSQLGVTNDGIFGPITEGAVKQFQSTMGLAPTGVIDAKTWAELFASKVVFYDDDAHAVSSSESVRASVGTSTPDADPVPAAEHEPESGTSAMRRPRRPPRSPPRSPPRRSRPAATAARPTGGS